MMTCAVVVGLVTACASTPPPRDPGHDRALSVVEHYDEAQRHDRVAREHAGTPGAAAAADSPNMAGPPGLECVDQPLVGEPSTGGEPIRIMRPCWTVHQGPSARDREVATIHRRAAAQHRAQAVALVEAERKACAEMGEEELSHGPFYHRDDIAAVVPVEDGGTLRGVRVTFREVTGLSARWLRQAVLCHRTRAAVMGYSASFMPESPLALDGVTAQVEDAPGGPVVTLRADREAVAAEALRRVRALQLGNAERRGGG